MRATAKESSTTIGRPAPNSEAKGLVLGCTCPFFWSRLLAWFVHLSESV